MKYQKYGVKMKTLVFGLMSLSSISAFAGSGQYTCNGPVSLNEGNELVWVLDGKLTYSVDYTASKIFGATLVLSGEGAQNSDAMPAFINLASGSDDKATLKVEVDGVAFSGEVKSDKYSDGLTFSIKSSGQMNYKLNSIMKCSRK